MSTQKPSRGNYSSPQSSKGNRTIIILASILAVIAVLALIVAGWAYANRGAQDTAATTTATSVLTSAAEDTTSPPSSEPATVTLTSTVRVEETTQPSTTATTTATSPTTSTGLPADVCNRERFQDAGHDFVDNVMFCDQGWARAGLFQSDYVRVFHWVDDAWAMYPPSGESETTGYPCYDTAAMAAQGAPNLLLMETLDCEFAQ